MEVLMGIGVVIAVFVAWIVFFRKADDEGEG